MDLSLLGKTAIVKTNDTEAIGCKIVGYTQFGAYIIIKDKAGVPSWVGKTKDEEDIILTEFFNMNTRYEYAQEYDFLTIDENDSLYISLTVPAELGLKDYSGDDIEYITIEKSMVSIIHNLWSRDIGATYGYAGPEKAFASIILGSKWDEYPAWVIRSCINRAVEVINKYAKFPIGVYSPAESDRKVYFSRKHFDELVEKGIHIDENYYIVDDI